MVNIILSIFHCETFSENNLITTIPTIINDNPIVLVKNMSVKWIRANTPKTPLEMAEIVGNLMAKHI